MCRNTIMYALNGKLEKEDIEKLFYIVEDGATYNRDATGIVNNRLAVIKTGDWNKVDISKQGKVKKILENSEWIITHNRLETKGDSKYSKNNHPFETKDFMMIHNGSISNSDSLKVEEGLKYEPETDSAIIINLIQKKTDEKCSIKEAIEYTIDKIWGSYSVLLIDKRNGDIYYFKNKSTSFTWAMVENKGRRVVIGCTSEYAIADAYTKENMIFRDKDCERILTQEAESGVLYRIREKKIEKVCKLEEIEKKKEEKIITSNIKAAKKYEVKSYNKTQDWSEEEELDAIKELIDDLAKVFSSFGKKEEKYIIRRHSIEILLPYDEYKDYIECYWDIKTNEIGRNNIQVMKRDICEAVKMKRMCEKEEKEEKENIDFEQQVLNDYGYRFD